MILVDTGYFLALFNPSDQHRMRAIGWSRNIKDTLIVPEYVLWEAINALSRHDLRLRANGLVDMLQSEPQFHLIAATPELRDAGMKFHRSRPDKNWSLTDCISFHVMAGRGITQALAYDQHFEQAGFEALLRRDP